MKKLLFLSFLLLPIFTAQGMKRKPDELEEEPSKVIKIEKELSPEIKDRIQWLQGLAARGEFSNEIGAQILKQLADVKVSGGTQEQKLYNAVANIRKFMEAFPQFYGDKQINGYLIERLAENYTHGLGFKVAIALATTGAGQWMAEFFKKNDDSQWIAKRLLTEAARFAELSQVKFILSYLPIIINEKSESSLTALMYAAVNNDLPMVTYLSGIPGVDVNAKNNDGVTALMLAAREGHLEVLEALLQAPGIINVNETDNVGYTALTWASAKGHLAVVERLLQVPLIAENVSQDAALIAASAYGHLSIVERLLQEPRIAMNMQNRDGMTALMAASSFGHLAVVERLLEVPGIEVNIQSEEGKTALIYAIYKDNLAIVEKLLQAPGIDINTQGGRVRRTALVDAVGRGNLEIVTRLLRVPNINVNARLATGDTVLKLVRKYNVRNKDAIIKLLIEHGAHE